ncbi:MAG TPA: prenyltransferase/squalene oxidase repeat-containing protein [Gaiellaceae bacterium]|nr:prenyltransferase/squalene oxidase repeat-containing protein [Gaiellaceae bacterium]
MKVLALPLVALALATPITQSADYLESRRGPDGGVSEPGGRADAALTAWTILALRSIGRDPGRASREYVRTAAPEDMTQTALRALALGDEQLLNRLDAARQPDGRIGPLVNSTAWSVLALRAAGRPAGPATVRYLLRQQRKTGGWSWHPRGPPDSNDTAVAIQALRAAGVRGRPLSRGARFLRRLQAPSGGFRLVPGREPDAQSTAWAIQGLLAAGLRPGPAAYRYLARLRRPDGSYRYSKRYAVTPVWVTAQVVPALAGKPFPLR